MIDVKTSALLGLVVGLSACAAHPPQVPDLPSERPISFDRTSPVDGTSLAEGVSSIGVASSVAVRVSAPTELLSLETAIETALLNNPALQADFAAFEAAALEEAQASSLADPRVSYTQFVEGVQTRVGEQEFAGGVSQLFPWFGKLRLRGDVARSEAMRSLQTYRFRLLEVREQVQTAWRLLSYEQAALILAEEDKRTIEQTLEAASALYSSGQQGRGALLQAQTELARIENELTGYPARIAGLRERLARLLFIDEVGDVVPLSDLPDEKIAPPDVEALIAEAVAFRPEIERYRWAEAGAELRRELALKEYYPDFTLGVNYIGVGDRPDSGAAPSDEGDDAWGLTLGLNIPLPNARRLAARRQALHRRDEAQWRRIAAESEIEEEVRGLLPRLDSLERQLDILRTNLLPLAEETYAANQAGYTSGRATFLDLLDAQRTLTAVRRDLLMTRRDYLLAIAELERAVGGPLTMEAPK